MIPTLWFRLSSSVRILDSCKTKCFYCSSSSHWRRLIKSPSSEQMVNFEGDVFWSLEKDRSHGTWIRVLTLLMYNRMGNHPATVDKVSQTSWEIMCHLILVKQCKWPAHQNSAVGKVSHGWFHIS
ncbi:hypothetical protein C5167_011226 [Papaver somniferum]|uniref:Uncharacterized protein n=1 Tax=Papaver somniferum TaxID=3469 RepID=A0A4Y7K6A8_PAPSO|nr:hypothetical protein C5167_011226 [Papaver somniferum]